MDEKLPTYARNIKELPDGQWCVRFRLGNKTTRRRFPTKDDAKNYLGKAKSGIVKLGHLWAFLTHGQRARIMVVLEDLSEGKGNSDREPVPVLARARNSAFPEDPKGQLEGSERRRLRVAR